LTLEYDLPDDSTEQDRSKVWELPARIKMMLDGSITLLNVKELEQRNANWLKKANWTKEICGQWIFTWNAFKIECEPQAALEVIENYDLRSQTIEEDA